MDTPFRSERLAPDQARLAYPLVRLADPTVTLESWLSFARRVARRKPERAGVMTLRDARGYMHALYSYDVERDARFGLRLRIRDLVIGRLPETALTAAVLHGAEALARALSCDALLVDVPIPPTRRAHLAGIDPMPGKRLSPATVTYLHSPLDLAQGPARGAA